jgi:hypothetical protein
MRNLEESIYLALSGLVVTIYKILRLMNAGQKVTAVFIAMKITLMLIVSVLIVGKLGKHLGWSLDLTLTASAFANMFSEKLMAIAEKKITKKLEDKLDQL